MQNIVQHCGTEIQQEMQRFGKLHDRIIEVVTNLLRKRLPTTNTMVENLVAIELSYINTKHPDFHDAQLVGTLLKNTEDDIQQKAMQKQIRDKQKQQNAVNSLTNQMNAVEVNDKSSDKAKNKENSEREQQSTWISNLIKNQPVNKFLNGPNSSAAGDIVNTSSASGNSTTSAPPTPYHQNVQSPMKPVNLLPEVPSLTTSSLQLTRKEKTDCSVIERLIRSYFLIVKKSIQDTVPKAIMHFMVNYVKDNLQSELVTHLYKHDHFEELLSESELVSVRRREASEMLKALQKASQIIGEIRETHVW
ncbi:Dynamin-1-like protein [Leptotrombidium deliense]|uniref:Dynamin-1-like protein n=1 Tax=Leptotrombidium deliense TaxID=299467 RepID=A0A443S5P8_9ACAR|nr:Dynamin-1-like protein [Leptotrombidium deliense]